jgi:hypothetical protein
VVAQIPAEALFVCDVAERLVKSPVEVKRLTAREMRYISEKIDDAGLAVFRDEPLE